MRRTRWAPQSAPGSGGCVEHKEATRAQHRGDPLHLSTKQRQLALLDIEAVEGLEHLDHQLQLTRGLRLREFPILHPRWIAGFSQQNLAFHFRDLFLQGKHTSPFVRATGARVGLLRRQPLRQGQLGLLRPEVARGC